MEEIFPLLKDMFKKSIDIQKDESNLLISIIIKSNVKGNLAEPEEIIIMLKMFGGLKEDIPIDIDINNESQIIELKFEDNPNFEKVSLMMDKIWDNVVDMLIQLVDGNYNIIKDIPNIDD
ncbi:MAG: hypothetical protein ACFE85_08505 [Candidatus Hodarchaeota archaeon]